MDSEQKYYTPSLDEFHVGFEYEEQHTGGYWIKKNSPERCVWTEKQIGQHPIKINGYLFSLDLNKIRVKYLDEEDINNLGWKETSLIFMHGNMACYKHVNLTFYLYKSRDKYVIFDGKDMPDGVDYFNGTIKNKSELKKIMQQIQII